MTWFRTDDDLPEHVKADALEVTTGDPGTLAAAWMTWLHMGCDCARRRTDGVFSLARAHRAVRLPPALVTTALGALVTVGLLDVHPDGYCFHDWSDYQPTKEELDADRRANADRQKAWRVRQREMREAKARNAVTNAVTDSVTNGVRNERLSRETTTAPVHGDTVAPVTAPRPVPSRPEVENPERAGVGVPPPRPAESKAPRAPKLEDAELPPTEPLARAVYDAIRGDAFLCPVTRLPADLASRMTAPGAFPGVNVLGQVLRAAAWNAGQRKKKRDGRAFLLGWVGRADPEAPTDSGVYDIPAPPRPAAPPVPRVLGVPVANPVKAGAAAGLLENLRAQGTHDASR